MGTKFSQKMRFVPIKKKKSKKFFFVITVRKLCSIFEIDFRKSSISRDRILLQRWIMAHMKKHIRDYMNVKKLFGQCWATKVTAT